MVPFHHRGEIPTAVLSRPDRADRLIKGWSKDPQEHTGKGERALSTDRSVFATELK